MMKYDEEMCLKKGELTLALTLILASSMDQ